MWVVEWAATWVSGGPSGCGVNVLEPKSRVLYCVTCVALCHTTCFASSVVMYVAFVGAPQFCESHVTRHGLARNDVTYGALVGVCQFQ